MVTAYGGGINHLAGGCILAAGEFVFKWHKVLQGVQILQGCIMGMKSFFLFFQAGMQLCFIFPVRVLVIGGFGISQGSIGGFQGLFGGLCMRVGVVAFECYGVAQIGTAQIKFVIFRVAQHTKTGELLDHIRVRGFYFLDVKLVIRGIQCVAQGRTGDQAVQSFLLRRTQCQQHVLFTELRVPLRRTQFHF